MTRWEFKIVPCLAGGNASATCLKMLVIRYADVPLSLPPHCAAQYIISCYYYYYMSYFSIGRIIGNFTNFNDFFSSTTVFCRKLQFSRSHNYSARIYTLYIHCQRKPQLLPWHSHAIGSMTKACNVIYPAIFFLQQ